MKPNIFNGNKKNIIISTFIIPPGSCFCHHRPHVNYHKGPYYVSNIFVLAPFSRSRHYYPNSFSLLYQIY